MFKIFHITQTSVSAIICLLHPQPPKCSDTDIYSCQYSDTDTYSVHVLILIFIYVNVLILISTPVNILILIPTLFTF